ncbi:MAG: ARPP-1 family domain-containing protein [Flavobacteriales bacterium]|jgi:hypothetical protein
MKTVLFTALILILWTSKSYAQQPDWITNRPNSSLHYIGIASAEKNNTNYQKIAKRNALDDLLSEIRVTIQSVSILNQMDNNGVFKEEYQSIIKSTVADEIENLELVATHEDETHYYVYYRILKEEYANQKQRNKEQAQKMALQFFEKAKSAESTKDYVTAIDFYLQSLLAIKAYWGENIEVTYDGKSIFLAIESYTQLQKLLDSINLTSDAQTINFNSRTENKTLVIQAKDNENNTISKVPLMVSFLPQRAQQKNYFTNENGQASITLGLTNNVDFNQVEVILNLKNFSKGSSDDRYYQYLMQSLRCPTQKIDIVIPDQLAMVPARLDGDLFPFNLDYVNIDFSNESSYTFQNLRLIPIRATENFKVMVGSMGYYITLQEAINSNRVVITEVSNSGTVNTLLVRNLSSDTLFIMSGEILVGGKQDRVVARDILIPPNSGQVKLSVFCVEEKRWQYTAQGEKFQAYYGMANEHLRNLIDHNAGQNAVWREVSSTNKKDGVYSATDSYTAHANNANFRRREEEYIRFFENIFNDQKDIIGVLAVTGNTIEGADLFVSNRLFMQEYRKLLYSYIDDAITYGAPVTIDKVTIDNYLTQLLTPQLQQSFIQERGQAFRRGNQVIHIAVY